MYCPSIPQEWIEQQLHSLTINLSPRTKPFFSVSVLYRGEWLNSRIVRLYPRRMSCNNNYVKLTVPQLVWPLCKPKVLAVYNSARHQTLSWSRWIQFLNSQPIYLKPVLISSSHDVLGSHVVSSLQDLQVKLCMYFSSLPYVLLASPIYS